MLRKEDFAVIKALKKRDVYVKDIAAELGVHPKTVSPALRRGPQPRRQSAVVVPANSSRTSRRLNACWAKASGM